MSVTPDAAVGIAMFPEQADDAGQLLQRAKHALHEARGHRDRIWLYKPSPGDTEAIDQLEYENRLRTAIEQNTLTLHFQPQLDMRTGRMGGAEALLRWNDDVLGQVPPHLAVRAAESAGLMDHLTMWVITSAIQACREFQKVDPGFHGQHQHLAVEPARGRSALLRRPGAAHLEREGRAASSSRSPRPR